MTIEKIETQEQVVETQKLTNNKDIIAYLAERFPLCFSVEGEAKPLKVGIFQDLAEALQDDERVSKTQLRQALRQYTSNWRYLYGCKLGAQRVDLHGNEVGQLEQEHVDHAVQQLAEAKAKIAEKRKAERLAANAEAKKKRSTNRVGNKTNTRKPKATLKPAELNELVKGSRVKVKVGDKAQSAIVIEVSKDEARVELQNGLVISVGKDRLFA